MNPEAHRTVRESLGAYALGHLDPDEATGVRAHLDGCADCRAELAEIEPVVTALGAVDPDALTGTPAPPPDLGDRIVARARTEPRRRRSPTPGRLVAAGVVIAALAGGLGFLGAGVVPDGIPREPVAVRATDPALDVSAVAIPHTWGVEITLDADGFRAGEAYAVVVLDDTGRRVDAGRFVGTGDERMRCNLNSSVLRADAAGFDVVDDSGAVVVHGDL